jgi:predicted DNA-binding transcriptional regulator AlpA
MRLRDVVHMVGVSRTTLWRMVQANKFPAPIRITERSVGYLQEAVESWMRARAAGQSWDADARSGEAAAAEPTLAFARPRRGDRR